MAQPGGGRDPMDPTDAEALAGLELASLLERVGEAIEEPRLLRPRRVQLSSTSAPIVKKTTRAQEGNSLHEILAAAASVAAFVAATNTAALLAVFFNVTPSYKCIFAMDGHGSRLEPAVKIAAEKLGWVVILVGSEEHNMVEAHREAVAVAGRAAKATSAAARAARKVAAVTAKEGAARVASSLAAAASGQQEGPRQKSAPKKESAKGSLPHRRYKRRQRGPCWTPSVAQLPNGVPRRSPTIGHSGGASCGGQRAGVRYKARTGHYKGKRFL
eukprot:CAMPEP_0181348636 /NCGR_PEP_ID=MMETSP1106-20121128/289_1 /TAXON_ID=81844 /ORGANISM="Mantoniella antarctica, Strain SL-175" /LENGTH=271 /DNA_ID=CAMNT_0023460957 /DNA_START=200 /DNA_END=1012 /DNA_ORIENTATION=+